MVTYIFVWMTCGCARLKNVEMATSHVLLVREKRENKSQRQGYLPVNQHSPSKCNLKDGKGGISHIGFPWSLLNTFDASFAPFIQTEAIVCVFFSKGTCGLS